MSIEYDDDPKHMSGDIHTRSPVAIAKPLAKIAKGKVFCDLGCGNGDVLLMVKPSAKTCIGIEGRHERAAVAIMRGFHVAVGNFKHILPIAEVYYAYIEHAQNANLIERRPPGTTLVLGCDTSVDGGYMQPSSEVIKVPYNEGPGKRENGVFELWVYRP